LFVNSKAVCFGPARGDLEHWPYESVDIAPNLKPGKNLLATEVWNFGELKPWAQFTIKTAFIIQGNSVSEEIVNTDSTWKVIKNRAHSPASAGTKETIGQFVVVGPCDRVDATLYPWARKNESSIGGVPPEGMDYGNSSILSMQFSYTA